MPLWTGKSRVASGPGGSGGRRGRTSGLRTSRPRICRVLLRALSSRPPKVSSVSLPSTLPVPSWFEVEEPNRTRFFRRQGQIGEAHFDFVNRAAIVERVGELDFFVARSAEAGAAIALAPAIGVFFSTIDLGACPKPPTLQ